MIIYRISHAKYADKLSSSGASNRWNQQFQFVIYGSGNISLCALELLVHTCGIRPAGEFIIMEIEVSDEAGIASIDVVQLPKNWNELQSYAHTQTIRSDWYESKHDLLLKVPSAIIPTEYNYIINTQHPGFNDQVSLKNTSDFFWDSRFPVG